MAEEDYFRSVERNAVLDDFLRKHPESDIEAHLSFLLDQFPQVSDGKVNYLIDGGVAMSLLHPSSRTSQRIDLDISTPSPEIQTFFARAYEFGVTPVRYWLEQRGFTYSAEAEALIMGSYKEISLENGRKVFVASPALLAYTKSSFGPFRELRAKDVDDLKVLGIREEIIRRFHSRLVWFSELAAAEVLSRFTAGCFWVQ